jgi:molecular chaperone Hsp33
VKKSVKKDIPKDKVHKFLAKDLSFRASIVTATDVVREMRSIQITYPVATMAVGRSMMGAALMASHLKNNQLVSLYFRGNGPIEMFFAEADHEGHVRGFTPNPQLELPWEQGQTSVRSAIGIGLLTVVHSHPQLNSPQRGTVELQSGEVAEDVAYYLYQSHQIRSVVALGVKVNTHGMVQGAAGILIELLPDSKEGTIEKLEKNFAEIKSISEIVAAGGGVDDIIGAYLKDLPVHELAHPHHLEYHCRCSKERLGGALALLGHLEVEDMIKKNEPAEARCEFCGRRYVIDLPDLKVLLEKLRSGPVH